MPYPDSWIRELVFNGTSLYAGGEFSRIGGQNRKYFAAIDSASSNVTSWNPNSDGMLTTIAFAGSKVYVGGKFNRIGGQNRNKIAALEATTGLAGNWNPGADNDVYKLVANDSIIFACGTFKSIGGQSRNGIAALNATTGMATNWNPNVELGVSSLALNGPKLYAGGTFKRIGSQPTSYFAAFNLSPTTNLKPTLSRQTIKVIPNPTTSTTILHFEQPISQDQQLQLVNALGQVVKVIAIKSGAKEATLDLLGMPTGLYRVAGYAGVVVKE